MLVYKDLTFNVFCTGQKSISANVEFSVDQLLRLKCNDNGGEERHFSVIEKVQDRWWEIGIYLGFQVAELNNIEQQRDRDGKKCLMSITDKWIRNSTQQCNDRYSPTWDGLINLLLDIQESRTAEQLKEILLRQ